MSIQEDPLLSKISVLIAHIQAQSTASSQQQVQDVFIDVSVLLYTLSLLYASYKISSKSSSSSGARPLNNNNVRDTAAAAAATEEEEEEVVPPFRFLALPPEIRFMIYEYLLVSPLPDGRIKCSNGHVVAAGVSGGLGLSPQILRVNSEIYAEAVGVLYERNVFQMHFFEEEIGDDDDDDDDDDNSSTAEEVWGLKDWQKNLFRGRGVREQRGGCGKEGEKEGEDEDSADLNRAIEAPGPGEAVLQPGPGPGPGPVVVAGPMRLLLQRLVPRFMQNLLGRVRFLRQNRGTGGMNNYNNNNNNRNRALCRFRPTKIHPHRLRRMRHLEIISSFRGTLSGSNAILVEDVEISPSGENAFMNDIVIELLEYLVAAPSSSSSSSSSSSEDMLIAEDDDDTTASKKTTTTTTTTTEKTINNSERRRKTLQLIHRPDRLVWPDPRLTLAEKRRLRNQIRKKFEILHALTHTRRVSVRQDYCLMDSEEDVIEEFEESDLPIVAGKKGREGRLALWSKEQMTARVCAGRVGIWEE